MAHIFKHRESGKLYTVEHLKVDLHHADCGARTGIYAYPYQWEGDTLTYLKQDHAFSEFRPEKFLSDTFEIVAEKF